MQYLLNRKVLLATILSTSLMAFAQGGGQRRNTAAQGNAPQQTGAAQAGNQQPAEPGNTGTPASVEPGRTERPTARGAATTPGAENAPANNDFFGFDAKATQARHDTNVDMPPVETHSKISYNGQSLAYTAHVGFLPLLNATTGSPEAHIFFTSYVKDNVSDVSKRPIMFFFGGAPGVSPAWQDFGGLGPKRMSSEGTWVDNPHTVLNQADLVFVNPVGTGFSFPAQVSRGSIFWNTSGDIASLAAFVRTYINRNDRLASPLFVAGEDAATGRVAGLAEFLNDHMIPVRGVVLLSMTAAPDAVAGDAQYLTLLPSLTLASWYHKKLTADLNGMSTEQIAARARQFASREYLHGLYNGDRMTAEDRAKVITDLAKLTGLSKAFIVNNNFRVTLDRYNAELMRDEHRGLSRSDARVTGFLQTPVGFGGGRNFLPPPPPVDFNLSAMTGSFAASYLGYLRRELKFPGEQDRVFYLSSGGIGSFNSTGNDQTSLTAAFAHNPNLHLFVAINYFDLGSPFYATEFGLAHLNISPEVRAHNITISHQEAGQMDYMDEKAAAKLEKDLAGFVTVATATK